MLIGLFFRATTHVLVYLLNSYLFSVECCTWFSFWHRDVPWIIVRNYVLLYLCDASFSYIYQLNGVLHQLLRNTPLNVAPFTVDLDDGVEMLKNLLDLKSNDVRISGW